MIKMEALVRAAHLAPSVGPFTIRRLLFRAGVFSADDFSAEEIRSALPIIEDELRELLAPSLPRPARTLPASSSDAGYFLTASFFVFFTA